MTPESAYPGMRLLLRIEENLDNYNEWIVGAFVAGAAGRLTAQAKVLDFGCGIGTLSRKFAARTGIVPDGVELDAVQREMCRGRGFRCHPSLDEALPEYDVIFTSNVLEHIEDDRETLAALRERLSPGGVLIVYVPAFMLLWTRLDENVGHFRRYTKRELAAKLEQSGFRVVQARYFDSVGFALAILFRLAGSGDGEPSSRSLALFDRYLVPASRALDIVLSRVLGKNVLAVAERGRRPG